MAPDPPARAGIAWLGDPALLDLPLVALACSAQPPPGLVLPAYDLAAALRDAGVATVGGFHTPVERDCLRVLLKGGQPVVVCPARGVAGMRLPPEWRAVAAGRLLVVSPFPAGVRRPTAALAAARNRFVGRLCAAALVVYAAPGGRTEGWCREVLGFGKPLWVLEAAENAALIALGARPLRAGVLPASFA